MFTSEYIKFLQTLGPKAVRFMDATYTNNNVVEAWADRTLPMYQFPLLNNLTHTNVPYLGSVANPSGGTMISSTPAQETVSGRTGVPWEFAIELANEIHSDIWVNVPPLATDDYVTHLASLLKSNLVPDVNIYVEYGNEMWNYGTFQQPNWAAAMAVQQASQAKLDYDSISKGGYAAGNSYIYQWEQRFVAYRSMQISQDFATVFGSNNPRVRVVLPSQESGGPGSLYEGMLQYIKANFGNPTNYFYGLAGASYLGLTSSQDQPSLTSDQIIADLPANIPDFSAGLRTFVTQAKAWGLAALSYEGGPIIGGTDLGGANSAHLIAGGEFF